MNSIYSHNTKKEVVEAFLNGIATVERLSEQYSCSQSTIRMWIDQYKTYGESGIEPRQRKYHTFKKKLFAVRLYKGTNLSYRDVAEKVGVKSRSIIRGWVKKYDQEGIEGLLASSSRAPDVKGMIKNIDMTNLELKDIIDYAKHDCEDDLQEKLLQKCFLIICSKIEDKYDLNKCTYENEKKAMIVYYLHKDKDEYFSPDEKIRVKDLGEMVGITRATYYYWKNKIGEPDPDQEIIDAMHEIRKKHPHYGYRRIRVVLEREYDIKIGDDKCRSVMRKEGLLLDGNGRDKKYKRVEGGTNKKVSNKLNRKFKSLIPRQKIVTDTTEIPYYEYDEDGELIRKKFCFDPYIDLHNREIISYTICDQTNGDIAVEGLRKAIEASDDCITRRTFHSDQALIYRMYRYQKLLEDASIFQSMSRAGNCFDNAVVESFFGTMKYELLSDNTFTGREEAVKAIEDYVDYYNNDRIQEGLDYYSPVEYRRIYERENKAFLDSVRENVECAQEKRELAA